MKITLAQINPVVGDISGNTLRLLDIVEKFHRQADLIVFPELYLTGYPPRDLLEKRVFIQKNRDALDDIILASRAYPQTGILFGMPVESDRDSGRGLYNSAVLVCGGELLFQQHKSLLPFYDVFDESRYFDPAPSIETFLFKGHRLGVTICEDAWNTPEMWPAEHKYCFDPQKQLAYQGADLFINISASPYYLAKEDLRCQIFGLHAQTYGIPFIYVNQVGANDELIFDGRSMAINAKGETLLRLPAFEEAIMTVDTEDKPKGKMMDSEELMESLFKAMVLGIQDYFKKTGFYRAIIGLSGGIDSALTAALAVAALGKENVLGITMPSQYSSAGSVADSRRLAENLGIELNIIPIITIYEAYIHSLQNHLAGRADVTEENIQARIRGNLLMAFANKQGAMVLSTGNKSELAVGYCTLYGDMSGGLCVLSDVPKTMVYELSRYINRESEIIPPATLVKEPSAELRPDQKDQDTLPPYEILDAILNDYIEENLSTAEIISRGFDPDTVRWVVRAVNRNEYKRKQAAPGLKVSSKAFGMGRRMPVAAKFEV